MALRCGSLLKQRFYWRLFVFFPRSARVVGDGVSTRWPDPFEEFFTALGLAQRGLIRDSSVSQSWWPALPFPTCRSKSHLINDTNNTNNQKKNVSLRLYKYIFIYEDNFVPDRFCLLLPPKWPSHSCRLSFVGTCVALTNLH